MTNSVPAVPGEVDVRATLESKLRLFLSADIVGSTAFKQKEPDRWFAVLRTFYQVVASTLEATWVRERDRASEDASYLYGDEPPLLWKTIGDEVLYTIEAVAENARLRAALSACERAMVKAAESDFTGGDEYHEAAVEARAALTGSGGRE